MIFAALRRKAARLILGPPVIPPEPPERIDGTLAECTWPLHAPHDAHAVVRTGQGPNRPLAVMLDCPGIPEPPHPARDLYAALVARRDAFLYADPFLTGIEPTSVRLHPRTWGDVFTDDEGHRWVGSFLAEGGAGWTFADVSVTCDPRMTEGTAEVRWTDGRVTSEDFAGERVS